MFFGYQVPVILGGFIFGAEGLWGLSPPPAAEAASSDKPFRFTLADTTRAAKKLSWSTGKAAWTFGTSFLLLVVPLIIQLHREEQMMALEQEQLSVLNSGGAAASSEPAK